MVTVEEGALRGGLGSLISLACQQKNIPGPVLSLGLAGTCITQGSRECQLKAQGLDAASIARQILAWRSKQ